MYPTTRPRRRGRTRLAVAGILLAGLLLAAVAVLWQAESAESVRPEQTSAGPPTAQDRAGGGHLPAAVAATDPVVSAVAWLQATRSLSYAEPPSGWIDRVRPVVTDRLAADYDRLRDGGAGVDWPAFVADGCVSVVADAAGVIPLEAPRTEDEVNVQVAGRLVTTCGERAVGRPAQDLAATITLVRGSDGLWLVDHQLF